MSTMWVLIADSTRARYFSREDGKRELSLLAELDDPWGRAKGVDLAEDRAGYESVGAGRGGAAFSPRLDPRTKEHEQFALRLARHCNEGVAAHSCESLAIFALSPFIGEIKQHLDAQARKALRLTAAHDFMSLSGRELEHRIDEELRGLG